MVEEPYPYEWFISCTKECSIRESIIYVARKEEQVVGFIRFYLWETNSVVSDRCTILSIDDIGVDNSLRNQGIGQEMMARVKLLAKAWNCDSIRLYVDAENESAYQYYLKCGFHVRNMGMGFNL